MEAIVLIGCQASGKSKFFAQRFADSHVRINLDMLRTRHREDILLRACLEMKQRFVVDNTNVTVEERAKYLASAKEFGFLIKGFYFESKIADLLQRNDSRPQPRAVSGLAVRGTHARLVLPTIEEGFDELYYVRIEDGGGFLVEGWRSEIR